MSRPYIICHMLTSLDGKVTGEFLYSPACATATDIYYQINRDLHPDAYACGRVTMEGSFTGGWQPDLTPYTDITIPREDFVADTTANFFAVAFDRRGRLGWRTPRIIDDDPGYDNAHIIEVLCHNTTDAYLAYLRTIGISYIFAGETDLDLPLALDKLHHLFGIQKLLLEGGSIINGAFQRADLIDEISLVTTPIVAATTDKPLFMDSQICNFTLTNLQQYNSGVLWLNYQKAQ